VEADFMSARKAALEAEVQDTTARETSNAVIQALNAASGGTHYRVAALLAAAHMRGTKKTPSGKWVSCNTFGLTF
jgi:hypothetical protein